MAVEKHTPAQLRRMEEYERAVDPALVAFYEQSQTMEEREANRARHEVCKAGERLASALSRIVGVDALGWAVVLRAHHARHIFNRHGPAGRHDKSLADSSHVGRMAYVLENFDEAGLLFDQNGRAVESKEYKNADGTLAPVVNIRMRIDGLAAVQQAVPDSKAHCVYVVSMRIQK